MIDIRQGDCREVMAAMEPASVDAIVTDPPYGLSFMGKDWDHGVPGVPFWAEALRVAKPGGHLLAFGGTRTYHRLACALEDVGFEIRDCLMWLYGSGFPKSLDVSKAIDKAAGAVREVGQYDGPCVYLRAGKECPGHGDEGQSQSGATVHVPPTTPATDASREWSGWGTALKPAWEPIILARKPLVGTVAANVLEHGTGALNVDGCRIGTDTERGERYGGKPPGGGPRCWNGEDYEQGKKWTAPVGRWPANVALDEEAARALDEQSGELTSGNIELHHQNHGHSGIGTFKIRERTGESFPSSAGGASRFFYTSKAASAERHYAGKNGHPTVKPVDLMRWLCRLVTPPGGLILDPFCGSGSTGVAALAEGFRFIGCELNPEYVEMARRRIAGPLFATLDEHAKLVGDGIA